jgi:hypothetical protein
VPSFNGTAWTFAIGQPGWVPLDTDGLTPQGRYLYCTSKDELVNIWVTCGDTGIVVNYVGAYHFSVFDMGPLNGELSVEAACNIFDTPGVLVLGTITHSGLGLPADSSVELSLSWE